MDLSVRLAVLAAVCTAAGGATVGLRRYFSNGPLPLRFDRRDVDITRPGPMLVEFTSPYCHECQVALPLLEAASERHDAPLAVIDARDRPDLTTKYSIRSTPTILVVDHKGRVTRGWQTSPTEEELTAALSGAGSNSAYSSASGR
jgi:thioredoxin-like negative regulator of GroEL